MSQGVKRTLITSQYLNLWGVVHGRCLLLVTNSVHATNAIYYFSFYAPLRFNEPKYLTSSIIEYPAFQLQVLVVRSQCDNFLLTALWKAPLCRQYSRCNNLCPAKRIEPA